MRIHSKVAVAFLALVIGLPLVFAQSTPVPRPEQPDGKDGPAMHDRMHPGPRGSGEERRGHGCRMGMHRRGWGEREFGLAKLVSNPSLRERLGISPEQAQKIRTQVFDFRKAQVRNRAELQVKHIELNDLLSADKPDRGCD